MKVVEVGGLAFGIRREVWPHGARDNCLRRLARLGDAGVVDALAVFLSRPLVIVGRDDDAGVWVFAADDLGDGLEVPRIECHHHRHADGLINAAPGCISLADIEDFFAVALPVDAGIAPDFAGAGEKSLRSVGGNEL